MNKFQIFCNSSDDQWLMSYNSNIEQALNKIKIVNLHQ